MKRLGSTTWNGGLREGKGSLSTESGALETYPYTFFSRYDEKPGTNPEELLGAAHAACFTMPTGTRLSRSQERQRPAALFPS
jgi:osmotically inducible protein OsmC